MAKLKEQGLDRKLVGFEMKDKGIARDEFSVVIDDEKVGIVTSGSPAPFPEKKYRLGFRADRICKSRAGN